MVVLFLLSSIGWTQSQDSSKQTTKVKIDSTIKAEKKSAKIDTTKKQKFLDENGNGIDDRLETKKKCDDTVCKKTAGGFWC